MATDTSGDAGAFETPVHIDSESHLQTLTEDHDIVLVDFFATWCGPCQMLEPTLEKLAAETDAVVAKVDVDQHQQLAGSYGVRGVPTIAFYADGEQVEQHTGVLPEDRLRSIIDQHS